MADKNFYELLGVDKKASTEDITKAYRKLVRKFHPDVSKEKDADTRMSEINAAYETLRDETKRAEYDQMLANPFGQGGAGFGQYGQSSNGFGSQGGFGFDPGQFSRFGGQGFDFSDLFGQFSGGNGRQHSRRDPNQPWPGEDQHARLSIDVAASYHGEERVLSLVVPVRAANGQLTEEAKQLRVKIPKGIRAGQQIRLSGQGMPGHNGGKAGDLFLEIQFIEQAGLQVNDRDVTQTIAVMPWELVLGGPLMVNTPAGRLEVSIPANSSPGKTLRLKGKGIPAKEAGDLYLVLTVGLPALKSEADKEAWQTLADHFKSRANP